MDIKEKTDSANITDIVVPDLNRGGSNDIHDASDNEHTIYIDPEEEKAVMRKFDRYLLPQAFIIILLNYLDRSNLGEYSQHPALMFLTAD
jgi:hypothetical protein